VALRHAALLGARAECVLLSDSFPPGESPAFVRQELTGPTFGWLRRYGHVPREYAFALAARRALERLHGERGLDCVLCHGHVAAALAAAPLKRRHNVPLVLVTHGDIFDRPPGTYDSRLTWFYRRVTPPAYRSADLVIALSPHMAGCAIRGGADPAAVKVLPNGIDPADIGLEEGTVRRAPHGAEAGAMPLRVLFVGTLARHKGVRTLIEACAVLRERGVPFEATLAGDGTDAGYVRGELSRLGLGSAVRLLGQVARSALGARYLASDVVCVPSLSDPLPTVVLEALAAGRPVVGSAVGGIPFLVREGVNGLLVPAGDAGALAGALASLAADRGLLARLASAARPSVLPVYSWSAIGDRLWALLEGVIAGAGRRLEATR
jgi:glycosyltransferase involved in cell wall biosynthesis